MNLDPVEFQQELFRKRQSIDPGWETRDVNWADDDAVKRFEYEMIDKLNVLQDMVMSQRQHPAFGHRFKELVLGERTTIQAYVKDWSGNVSFATSALDEDHYPGNEFHVSTERIENFVQQNDFGFRKLKIENSNPTILCMIGRLLQTNQIRYMEICGGSMLPDDISNCHYQTHCLL